MTQTTEATFGTILENALTAYDRIESNRSSYHPSAFYLLGVEIQQSLPQPDSKMGQAVFRSLKDFIEKKHRTGKEEEFFELSSLPDEWVDINSYMRAIDCRAFLLPAYAPNAMEHTAALCEDGWKPESYYTIEGEEMIFLGVVFTRPSDE